MESNNSNIPSLKEDLLNHFLKVKMIKMTRVEFLKSICKEKFTIHIGCYDYPIFKKETNLHLKLQGSSSILHGLDIIDGYESVFKHHIKDPVLFNSYKDVRERYDIVLAPEVIEHTNNAGKFLNDLFTIRAKEYMITAPCIYHLKTQMKYNETTEEFYEFVHQDHVAWYSPYTLTKLVDNIIDFPHSKELFFVRDCICILIRT